MGLFDTPEEKAEKRKRQAQEALGKAIDRTNTSNTYYLNTAIEKGADVLAPMEDGKTPFMHVFDFSDLQKSCLEGVDEVAAKLCLEHGAVFEGTQAQLLKAIKDCKSMPFALKLCDLLDQQEIKKNLQQDLFGALYSQMGQNGRDEVVDKLFSVGIPVHEKDSGNGRTLLHLAGSECKGKYVQLLLENGADANAVDNDLATPDRLVNWSDDIKAYICSFKNKGAPVVQQAEAPSKQVEESLPADNGEWCLSMADEVAHVTERNKLGYRITQLFNFTARTFTQISTNLKTGGESQTLRTFDEFEDTTIIERAVTEARRLKMDVSDSIVTAPMRKKEPASPFVEVGKGQA